jgi:hypothetical protein
MPGIRPGHAGCGACRPVCAAGPVHRPERPVLRAARLAPRRRQDRPAALRYRLGDRPAGRHGLTGNQGGTATLNLRRFRGTMGLSR